MEMLEAGVHFGHKKERSHPKAKKYIFTLREGIYVIDLEKTQSNLKEALEFLKKEVNLGKTILFIGTKRQAKKFVQEVAEKTHMPYINKRFLGGTLTNFETIRKNILRMEDLERQMQSPEFAALTKKEKKIITDKAEKLRITFDGVRAMKNLPDVLFVVDAAKESLALKEAKIMNIPIVAISDTDSNPEKIDYPIPANDDAPKAIEMILKLVEEAIASEINQKISVKNEENANVSQNSIVKEHNATKQDNEKVSNNRAEKSLKRTKSQAKKATPKKATK